MKGRTENASVLDLKNGYILKERNIDNAKLYSCLFCPAQFDAEDIYTFGKINVTAQKAIRLHIQKEHGDVFNQLLAEDKSKTGLTDTQKEFLEYYFEGMSDAEIAKKMNISASTVRYQRYNFREKAKQAKYILAMSELLEEREKNPINPVAEVDENTKTLESLFESLSPLVLKTFNMKKKKEEKRLVILKTILGQFEKGRKYSDKEVNAILKEIYEDYATIRRSLIDYGFMDRTGDCREYWVK